MKRRLLQVLLILLFVVRCCACFPQSIELRAGKSLAHDTYAALRLEIPSNYLFNFSSKIFYERARLQSLDLSAFGVDLMAEYTTSQDLNEPQQFSARLGFGGTAHIEQEPWVYGGYTFSKRFSYGFVAEATGEWAMSPAFSLCPFIQQKYLFKSSLGSMRFVFGIGIKFSFNQ